MIPLERAPLEAFEGLEGVIFDIDDTVTRAGKLEADAYSAMWRLAERGLTLIAVTGRPLGWVDVLARQWPVALAVGENGAGWVRATGGAVREGYFHDEATRADHRAWVDRVRLRVAAELDAIEVASDQRSRRCDLAFDIGEHQTPSDAEVSALIALLAEEGARMPAPTSTVHVHAVIGGWDKACGTVHAMREALDREPADGRWVFVGDSGNDAAAFDFFPLTVGVANVRHHLERLPTPPRFVTRADRGRGFAELAEVILRARSR